MGTPVLNQFGNLRTKSLLVDRSPMANLRVVPFAKLDERLIRKECQYPICQTGKKSLHTQRAAPTERKQKSFQPRGLQCNKLTTYSKYCSSHDRQAFPRSIQVFPVLELYLTSILAAHAVGPITERCEKDRQKE